MIKILFVLALSLFLSCADSKNKRKALANIDYSTVEPSIDLKQTHLKANEALLFCKKKKFNASFCVLIDMSLHSGVNRFFVWDFKKDTLIKSFLVGHGCGNSPWSYDYSKDKPVFSNVDGSHCTAIGKYKIGERGYSSWGINVKYLMHGLDKTNDNALARQIVFHGWDQMSEKECYPYGSPEGWGCPTLANNHMRYMDDKLKASKKPVLMWIYQ